MTKSIFIATAEPFTGKSIIALGLVNLLLGKAQKVGYFKPIINPEVEDEKDMHIQTVLDHFRLPLHYSDTYAFTYQQALRLLESEQDGLLLDTIITKYKAMEEDNDFTIVEGSDFVGEGTAFEFDTNVHIAKNLGAPVLIVSSGKNKTTSQVINSTISLFKNFESREAQTVAVVVNKVCSEQVDDVRELLMSQLPEGIILAVIPDDKGLDSPTMKEIYEQIGGNLMFGEKYLDNQVDHFVTGAMQVPNFLKHLKENVLIVTPGDRGDIIIGSLQANLSSSYPKVAGIVLTANTEPEEPIIKLIEGLQNVVPIISVPTGTFDTITSIGRIKSRITPDNTKKIQLAVDTFNKFLDVDALNEKLITYIPEGMTPYMFQYQLAKRAKKSIKHIVLPEGDDDRILKAACRLVEHDVVKLTILGNPQEVSARAKRLSLNIDFQKMQVIDPIHSEYFDDYAETLFELRRSKNITLQSARDLMADVSYFGTMMVYKGHADGMVSGAAHTTQHTIRPALQFVKTKPGISVVSSIFFMCLPDRVCVMGDCAVNPNPTAEQLAEIAMSSAISSRSFGIEPRVAMLSYSSGTSGEGADVEKVRAATELVKKMMPELKIEGPIQYDAAVDPVVGKHKLPNSEVAGQASVLIFPDLNTGNNTYKAVQRETGALAIGPMLQGLNKPVNDLSRGCTVDDIYNTVIITAIQAQQEELALAN